MARFVASDSTVEVNSVDLSDHVRSIAVNLTAQEVMSTAMGDTYIQRHAGGPKDGSVELEFIQDFAANEVYATLNPLLGTTVTVKIKPVDGNTSATNPEFEGSCFVSQVPFIDASFGELSTLRVTWPFNGEPTFNTT